MMHAILAIAVILTSAFFTWLTCFAWRADHEPSIELRIARKLRAQRRPMLNGRQFRAGIALMAGAAIPWIVWLSIFFATLMDKWMVRAALAVALLVVATPSSAAQSLAPAANSEITSLHAHRWLRLSQAVLLVGNGMDAASSWKKPELNPLLGPQFGARGVSIKFSISLGAIFGQNRIIRRQPEMERPFTWANFAAGAGFAGVAIRNWNLH